MMTIESKLKSLNQRELVVFDFDETIVDCNSDSWVHQLLEERKIPIDLEYRLGQDYFNHVQSVLEHLYTKGVRQEDYIKCLISMPAVEGIIDPLISSLAKMSDKYDMIILSDSNSFFIDTYLEYMGLDKKILRVLTNPARFEEDGRLTIEEYHVQDYCSLSSRNICKGEALKNFIGKQMLDHKTVYSRVHYVGDGENDFCPSAKLGPRDYIFPRHGYALDRLCKKMMNGQYYPDNGKLPELKATVASWKNGQDILNTIISASEGQNNNLANKPVTTDI